MTGPEAGRRSAGRASALVIAGATLWGTTGTAQALAPAGADPVTVGAVRIAVGGALLVLVSMLLPGAGVAGLAYPSRPTSSPPSVMARAGVPGGPPAALLVAAAAVVAYQFAFFQAVAAAGVAVGTVVALATAPVVAGAHQWWLERRRPGAPWFAATVLAVVGTALLVRPDAVVVQSAATTSPPAWVGPAWGVVLAVGAGVSFAVLTVASKRLIEAGSAPITVMAGAFGLAAVVTVPYLASAPFAWGADLDWILSWGGAATAAWLGGATAATAYLLFAVGLRSLEPPVVTTLALAEPVTATALGVLLLSERLGATAFVGLTMVVTGLVVVAVTPLLASRRTRRGAAAAAHATADPVRDPTAGEATEATDGGWSCGHHADGQEPDHAHRPRRTPERP